LDPQVNKFRGLHCPACNKPDILRPLNADGSYEELSKQTITVRDKKRYIDVCERCLRKYRREDYRAGLAKIQEVIVTNPQNLELA